MGKPKIRFQGYTEDWEQRKLGNMGSTFTGLSGKNKEDFGHGDAQFITYMNVFSNPVANIEMTEAIEIDTKQNSVKKGDVFFTTSSETPEEVGMSCVMPENIENIYLNSFCFGYRPIEKFDLDYLAYVLRADSFRKEMTFLAQGISRYNISKNKVMEVSIPVPNLEEQAMVGECFTTLDHLITLHQRKCDETKKLKKYMLQKMFPQNGHSVPEIRFSGFTEDWEQRKLEDVMDTVTDYVAAGSFEDIRNNVTYLNEPGYAQLVRTVDLKKKFTNNDSVYVDESAFKYLWRVNLNDECIVLPNIGANIGEVYFVEPSGLPYDNNVLGPNAILLKANEDTYFAFTALNNLTFQKQLFENVGSSGQPKFNKTELKSIQLYMPQNEEQIKIGQYFRKLDHLITLHQQKCEKLQKIKKFMLQNMFV